MGQRQRTRGTRCVFLLLQRWVFALLLAWWGAAGATNYTYGAWSFTLPDGAKESVQDGIRAFGVDGAVYLFTPPEPLAGRTLDAVAAATMADVTGGNTGGLREFGRRTLSDGGMVLLYSGTVTDPRTGQGTTQVYFFFSRNDQWGLALLMAGEGTNQDEALEPLGTVRFQPGPLTAAGGTEELPRLPALPWATPAAGRVAATAPGVDYPTARKRGLDPKQDLLPDTYDCYYVGSYVGDDVRAMTPTPDLRIRVGADGTYSLDDGVTRAPGRWAQTRPTGDTHKLTLSGPLVGNDLWVYGNDDHGQWFTAAASASERRVACYQAGPRAEAVRLELTRKRIGQESLTCQAAGGGAPYVLKLGDGTYTTPRGSGRVRLRFSGASSSTETWHGLVQFTGGPFDLSVGEMNEDEEGNRELEVTDQTTSTRPFYVEKTTTLVATCRARVSPKPTPLYGRAPAPKTGVSGGPDGLFVSVQSHSRLVGNLVLPYSEQELSLLRPDGYGLADLDPTRLGLIPDCGRTKPNGDPFCDRYTLKGGQLSFQDSDGTWDDPQPYRKTADGFTLGKTRYVRVTPLTAAALAGVYSTEDFSGSGPAGGALGGGAGIYNSLSSGYLFTPDGQFQWKYSSSSSTLISPSLITGGGAVGGGGSTRTDGGQGRYSLGDNWLTLTFSDGRVQRLFVYGQPAVFLKEDPTLGQRLNLGGTWLHRAPGKG